MALVVMISIFMGEDSSREFFPQECTIYVLFGCATKQCDYLSVFPYRVKVRHFGISDKRGNGLRVISSKRNRPMSTPLL